MFQKGLLLIIHLEGSRAKRLSLLQRGKEGALDRLGPQRVILAKGDSWNRGIDQTREGIAQVFFPLGEFSFQYPLSIEVSQVSFGCVLRVSLSRGESLKGVRFPGPS